jgi:hypothetical protein
MGHAVLSLKHRVERTTSRPNNLAPRGRGGDLAAQDKLFVAVAHLELSWRRQPPDVLR